jgi:glycosyltransferase involved in cell wall biosynthesis
MPSRYAALDVLLLTSWHEGTPLVVLEAMASGVPVVATEVGGVPELVVSGTTGWLATPGDEVDIAERTIALLQAPDTMRRFGEAGRARVRSLFSLDEQAQRTGALLRTLAYEAGKRHGATTMRPTLATGRGDAAAAS